MTEAQGRPVAEPGGALVTRESAQAILVVSNRLPFRFEADAAGRPVRKPSSGGLVSALEPVLRERGGTWVGWPGSEELPHGAALSTDVDPYQVVPVPLSDAEVEGYYYGFANRTVWPLFHSLVERTNFAHADWEAYEAVNRRFAEVVADSWSGEGLAWIHDYHLMRAPKELRQRLPQLRQAFFLHIPFPAFDIFRLLPWDQEVLRGLLACNLIGFHVDGYAQNFMDCVERLLGCRVDRRLGLIEYGRRTVRVASFPLGIDFELFQRRAREAPQAPPGRHRVVLGVDRLDYTKGIPPRLEAFEHLLEHHPELRERVVLLQIAVPSRSEVAEYQQLKRTIDELVGRINGRFATASWSPIQYLYRSVSPEQLAMLYRDADVCLVTPLRDGMNLVAKEYCASQTRDPGVLVLSRMAGSAETMSEALMVNPYDIPGMARAVRRALTMDEAERRSRMTALRQRERRRNVYAWVQDVLAVAASPQTEGLTPPSEAEFMAWLGGFLSGHRLVLFLDYDGTLTPIAPHPSEAQLSPEMRRTLQACLDHPEIEVAIMSGRALSDLQDLVALPGILYAGNNGLEIAGPGLAEFGMEGTEPYRERTRELAERLEGVARDGAWVEEKGLTLTFHYRQAPPQLHEALAEEARRTIEAADYQVRASHCALEARPPIPWDKGRAVLHILNSRFGEDWPEDVRVIYAGDDETDEDAFGILGGLGITFRVGGGEGPTAALRTLADRETLQSLLDWVVRFKS